MEPAQFALRILTSGLALLLCGPTAWGAEPTQDSASLEKAIDSESLRAWSAPFRRWHYWPYHVIPASPPIPGVTNLLGTDVPTIYQIPGDDKWYLSFVGFDGIGYQDLTGLQSEERDFLHVLQCGARQDGCDHGRKGDWIDHEQGVTGCPETRA